MGDEARAVGHLRHLVYDLDRPDRPPGQVGGLLDRYQPGGGHVPGLGPDGPSDLLTREPPVIPVKRVDHGAGQSRRATRLVADDVAAPVRDHLIAGIYVDLDGDLVAHGA